MNELFWASDDIERERGYKKIDDQWVCLLCDYTSECGMVYPYGEKFVDAEKKIKLHIEEDHGSVFEQLISMDKKQTGISEHQGRLLQYFYEGLSDHEVMEALNVGSVSTIRNHRHALKEKEKQAKTLTTIMTLLQKSMNPKNKTVKPHKSATMVDERYNITLEDSIKAIDKYFPNGIDGGLKTFSVKEKYKLIILREIIKKFDFKKIYTEKEVDQVLKLIYPPDHVIIRRYLIQYGFMDRERDCSKYWLKKKQEKEKGKKKMTVEKDRRKELVNNYVAKVESEKMISGIYQIKNLTDSKIYIGSDRNISTLNGIIFQLNTGSFRNKQLQDAWQLLGEDQFEITILEEVDEEEFTESATKSLKKLVQKWKEKLLPYGDKGYHMKR